MRDERLIRRTLDELETLGVDRAQARLATSDPLDLRGLVNQALERNALWIPVDGALRRALRALFGDLRAARGTVLTAQWLAARVSTAAVEATDPHSAAEPCEREAWARHLERVAATLGVCSTKSVDALALVHQLELEQRATLLHGITLASQRRTKEASPAFWTRFEGLLRSLMRALTADA